MPPRGKSRVEEVVDAAPQQEAPEFPPGNGAVVVTRIRSEDGSITWGIDRLLGDVTVDQVATGLRLAAKDVDKKLLGHSEG